MKIVKRVDLPSGWVRVMFRLPIHVYRLGGGFLFGNRLLVLNHIGRRSGQQHQTVLEVVDHDPTDDSYVVASGWGPGAAWYRNVVRTPEVSIQVGRRSMAATAVLLSADEGAEIFTRYAARHRVLSQHVLPRLMGFAVDGSDADFRAVGRHLPFVKFVPRSS